MDKELYQKITAKKEFSQLPKKDVLLAFNKFDKSQYSDDEKIKLTRDLLRKVFSAFLSLKLLNIKDKDFEWFLKKHLSTRERLDYYKEIYKKVLKNLSNKINVIDLGAGVNGFSYVYFKESGFKVNYFGIEAVKQLVDSVNNYFRKEKISGKAIHLSLFELNKIKEIIKNVKGDKIIFLFKTLDSLEMLKKDYSKKLLFELMPLVDKIVVSFATRSMIKKTRFKVKRNWIMNFIDENFNILDDFELGGERYVVFAK